MKKIGAGKDEVLTRQHKRAHGAFWKAMILFYIPQHVQVAFLYTDTRPSGPTIDQRNVFP
jgi:hypothetical protein